MPTKDLGDSFLNRRLTTVQCCIPHRLHHRVWRGVRHLQGFGGLRIDQQSTGSARKYAQNVISPGCGSVISSLPAGSHRAGTCRGSVGCSIRSR